MTAESLYREHAQGASTTDLQVEHLAKMIHGKIVVRLGKTIKFSPALAAGEAPEVRLKKILQSLISAAAYLDRLNTQH